MQDQEHLKAIKRAIDITEKWYCICGFADLSENININSIEIKIGELEFEDEGMKPIFAVKFNDNIYFKREIDKNLDVQYQLQNMFIHGDEYTIKINKNIDDIHNQLMKNETYSEFYTNIRYHFFNGKIKL